MRRTLLEIVKSVCGELGFSIPNSVAASNDLFFVRTKYIVQSACEEILSLHNWQSLIKSGTITLTGAESYSLPSDVDRILTDSFTHYVGTELDYQNVTGSVTPQTFNKLPAQVSSNITFTIRGGKIFVYPTSSTGTLKFDYISSSYIQNSSGVEYKNIFTQDDDIPLFDSRLIIATSKVKLLESLGLDTTAASFDFNSYIELAKSRDVPASVMTLDRGSINHLEDVRVPVKTITYMG